MVTNNISTKKKKSVIFDYYFYFPRCVIAIYAQLVVAPLSLGIGADDFSVVWTPDGKCEKMALRALRLAIMELEYLCVSFRSASRYQE